VCSAPVRRQKLLSPIAFRTRWTAVAMRALLAGSAEGLNGDDRMRGTPAPRSTPRIRWGTAHGTTPPTRIPVDRAGARVLPQAMRRAAVLLALLLVTLAPLGALARDGRCERLGEMMRAIAKARDAGLSRSEAYDVVRDATDDQRMRLVARIAVDAAYDCTTCSAALLEGTMIGYCEAQRGDEPPAAGGGRWL
jgi:hypothetical protein